MKFANKIVKKAPLIFSRPKVKPSDFFFIPPVKNPKISSFNARNAKEKLQILTFKKL